MSACVRRRSLVALELCLRLSAGEVAGGRRCLWGRVWPHRSFLHGASPDSAVSWLDSCWSCRCFGFGGLACRVLMTGVLLLLDSQVSGGRTCVAGVWLTGGSVVIWWLFTGVLSRLG